MGKLKPEGHPSEEVMQEALNKTLQNEAIMICKERIRKIMELDISTLTKYLFLYESLESITDIISKLSKEEKLKILQEIEQIDMQKNI